MPPPSGVKESVRRAEILEAAEAVLTESGYAGASMLAIARRAKASKETLYTWFGDKRGLFEALVVANATDLDAALDAAALTGNGAPRSVLTGFAASLLRILLGERAMVVNRAAIAESPRDTSLARLLITRGRDAVLPRLAAYLAREREAGRLMFTDATEAAEVLVSLVLGDSQIRGLLGVLPPLEPPAIAEQAAKAVDRFLVLFGRDASLAGGQ